MLLAPFILSPLLFISINSEVNKLANLIIFIGELSSSSQILLLGRRGSEMCLHHPLDGRVLADGGPPPPHHLHDAHGSAPDAGDRVHRSVVGICVPDSSVTCAT